MYYGVFKSVRPREIQSAGWTKDFLKKQQSGLTGHYQKSGYPFDTPMWNGGIGKIKAASIIYHDEAAESPMQDAWWPYEQTAYLLDGLLKVGILLDDQGLLNTVRDNIYWLIDHPEADGRLGKVYHCDIHWPMAVFFRAAMAWAEYQNDDKVRQAFVRHYSAVPVEEIAYGFRHINNLEGLLTAYGWSGKQELLTKAEKAYQLHNEYGIAHPEDEFELYLERLTHPENYVIHGVSFSEEIKLPVMLYMYTGKQEYLNAAEKGLEGVLERHEQLPGLPSANEDFAGRDPLQGYETCVINDFCWALRYFLLATGKGSYADRIERIIFNALPAAAAPDFHTLTYFTCVNQVIAAPEAHHSFFYRGSSCNHQFRPNHCAQCCPGNIHHIIPNFVLNQFFVTDAGVPTAVLYSAAEYEGTYKGTSFHISEQTTYPMEEEIRFHFQVAQNKTIPFSLRIPEWCQNPSILLNGKPFSIPSIQNGFAKIEGIGNGATLMLQLPMKAIFRRERNWCWFEAGPLLFSLPVGYEIQKEYEDDYAPLVLYPNTEWNWAPLENPKPELHHESEGPVIKILATKISGFDFLECGRYTPEIPLYARRISDVQTLSLVPYGDTLLRITAFPDGRNRKMLPIYQALVTEDFPFDWTRPISEQKFPPETMGIKELQAISKEIVADRDGYYDLIRNLGKIENRLTYVTLRFWSDAEGEATISVGASTVGECFVNGKKYYEQPVYFEAEFMSGAWFQAPVKKGYNALVVKVAKGFKPMQYRDAWGVRVNIFR